MSSGCARAVRLLVSVVTAAGMVFGFGLAANAQVEGDVGVEVSIGPLGNVPTSMAPPATDGLFPSSSSTLTPSDLFSPTAPVGGPDGQLSYTGWSVVSLILAGSALLVGWVMRRRARRAS